MVSLTKACKVLKRLMKTRRMNGKVISMLADELKKRILKRCRIELNCKILAHLIWLLS